MITIKIRNKRWFNKNCNSTLNISDWAIERLYGKILTVELDDGDKCGDISNARYFAKGYWIPNWAIEWVKEEPDNKEI